MASRVRRVHLVVGQAASFAADAGTSFRRNGLMTVAAVTTIMVALLVVGTAVLLGLNLSHMAATLEAQVEVVAFLRDGLSSSALARVQETLVAMPDVASVQFVSRAEALGRLRQRLGDSTAFADLESSNPLPDSLEVRLVDPARARAVAAAITHMSGVDAVTYGAQVLDRTVAAGGAIIVLAALYALGAARVASALTFFPLVSVTSGVQSVAIVVAATGAIVGAAGSLIAVRRFVMS